MALKTIVAQQYSYGFDLVLPSGLILTDVTSFEVEIRPPSGLQILKTNDAATEENFIVNSVKVPISDGDLTEVGIYDYQVKDVSEGKVVYGGVFQFEVIANLVYEEEVVESSLPPEELLPVVD